MQNGFITLHRKIKENPIFRNSHLYHLFSFYLLSANHEEKEVYFNGQFVTVKRGQLITGRLSISEQTGIPNGSIPRLNQVLVRLGMITLKPNSRFSLITVVKYNDYQSKRIEANSPQTADEQPANTNNNDNNVNNDNKEASVLKLWNKYTKNILFKEIIQKYPDRDYKFHFLEMCDWYSTKRKKLPQNISALTNWLKNTKPDESLQAERRREMDRKELINKQLAMAETPQASKEKVEKIREGMKQIGKNF